MADKQISVSIAFTADTNKAKQEINSLQQSLNKIISNSQVNVGGQIAQELNEASAAAAKLQGHLKSAINTDTGVMNFTAFNNSIQKAGTNVQKLSSELLKSGASGQQAFLQLNSAIARSEVPLRRTNETLQKFGQTLKNTITWQISSSMIHGFMGAIQGAYGYAQDLNKSLTNIRIVTGASADQMAKFAEQANKSAKALSTTTTKYTDAALIYYQQGLNDTQVKERTDITVKMANAAGISAQTASDQLTAIWNNFDNGSQSLEHYADVLVKLGAETASSSDEISQGMEKFAAIANTVGLSYEYAAAALATVTATTRQSADTVGTAFKTLFARLEGLQLGETLEDGTTLNKYSQALATVGVNIKDAAGQMKSMDTIIDELGNKWQNLGKDQQIALAQTVGGMRQYSQFIALMDQFDYFKENVGRAQNADGSLQTQADIYAESWEAASNRVKAAQQAIFQDLLKDQGFIAILNGLEKVLTGVDNFIDALGGVPGVLTAIGAISTQVFGQQMANGLRNLGNGVKNFFRGPAGLQADKQKTLDGMSDSYRRALGDKNGYLTPGKEAQYNNYRHMLGRQSALANAKNLTPEQQYSASLMEDRIQQTEAAIIENAARQEAATQASEAARGSFVDTMAGSGADRKDASKQAVALGQDASTLNQVDDALREISAGGDVAEAAINELIQKLNAMKAAGVESAGAVAEALEKIKGTTDANERKEMADATRGNQTDVVRDELIDQAAGEDDFNARDRELAQAEQAARDKQNARKKATRRQGRAEEQAVAEERRRLQEQQAARRRAAEGVITSTNESDASQREGAELLGERDRQTNAQREMLEPNAPGAAEKIVASANAFMSLGMAISNAQGIINTWNNTDLSFGEKLISTLTTGSMTVMMLAQAFQQLSNAQIMQSMMTKLQDSAITGLIAKKMGLTAATDADTAATITNTAAKIASLGVMALVLAAIVGVAIGVKMLVDAYNADAIAAERAAEASKKLADAEKEAKSELESVKSTLDSYDSAVEKLNQCTKGTEEWKDQLHEVNSLLLGILANNPEMADRMKLERNDNGMLEITNRDEILAEAELKAEQAQYANVVGNIQANKAQLKADETATFREFNRIGQYNQNGNLVQEGFNAKKYIDNADEYAQMTPEEFKQAVEQDGWNENLDGPVSTFQSALQKLANSAEQIATQMDMAGDIIADQYLGDKYDVAEKQIGSEKYQQAVDQIYDQIMTVDGVQGITRVSEKTNDAVAKLWERYQKAAGIDNELVSNDAVVGGAKNRSFQYIGDDHEVKTISLEEVATTIAAVEALEKLGAAAEAASQALSNIPSNDESPITASDWQKYIAEGDFGSFTQAEIEKLQQDYISSGKTTQEYLESMLGPELVGLLGENFVKQFEKQMGLDYNDIWDEATRYRELQRQSQDAYAQNDTVKAKETTQQMSEISAGAKGFVVLQDLQGSQFSNINRDAQLQARDIFSQFSGTDFEQVKAATGLARGLAAIKDPQELEDTISKLSSYSPEIWGKLKIDDYTDLPAVIAELQKIADSDPVVIRLRLDTLDDLKGKLKENMTGSEWEEWFGKAEKAGLPGLSTPGQQADFLAMSPEEREGYLNTMMDSQYAALENSYDGFYHQMEDAASAFQAVEAIQAFNGLSSVEQQTFAQNQGYEDSDDYLSSQMAGLTDEQQQLIADGEYDAALTQIATTFDEARYNAALIREDLEAAAEVMNEYNLSDEELETASSMAEDKRLEYAEMADAYRSSDDQTDSDEDGVADAEELAAVYEQLAQNTKQTEEWAQRKIALQNALEGLAKEYKDIVKQIDKAEKGSDKWTDGMDKLQKYVEDIADVKMDKTLGRAFTKMAKDTGALERAAKDGGKELKKMARNANMAYLGKQMKQGQKEANKFAKALEEGTMSAEDLAKAARDGFQAIAEEAFNGAQEQVDQAMSIFDQLQNMSEEEFRLKEPEIEGFLSTLALALHQTGRTTEQIEEIFNSMSGGFKAKITEETDSPPENMNVHYQGVHSFINEINTIDYEPGGQADMNIEGGGQITGFKVDIEPDAEGDLVEKGGGGGGGGGGKAKPPKPLKRIDPKVRYEGTKKRIENLAKTQETVEKKKETAYGRQKIAFAEKEIELKQRQIKLQTEYLEQTKNALELQKIDVADSLAAIGAPAVEWDVDGSVKNLAEIEEALLNYENAMIMAENAGADEFTLAIMQEIFDTAREGFDNLLDIIEDSLDAEKEFWEALNELAELNLGLIEIKVDMDVALAEADLEFIDYMLEKLVDEGYEAAESITWLGEKAENAISQIATYSKGIADILNNRGISMDELMNLSEADLVGLGFRQDEIDLLLEYRSAVIENMTTLNELRQEMTDKVSSAFDLFSEDLENQIDLFEHYTTLLEHFSEIATLTGSRFAKSELREIMQAINETSMANGQANIRAARQRMDALQQMYDEYMDGYAKAKELQGLGPDDTIFEYEETRKDMEEALRDSQEAFYEAWEETLNKATEILEKWVEDAGARFDEALSPIYQSLDRLEEAYERMTQKDENYYDNFEQLYHLSKLTRDITNSIDDTDNIKGKQRLKDLLKEITDIQARGVELSEYDVDVLRKRYELEQARQRLEDSEDNASLVRLQRDQEGNWGYVYTADEDAVKEAEQEYEDKLYELQKANDEYINELQERILELTTDCKEQLAEIAEDATLSPEEKQRLSQEILDFYNSQLEYITSQMDGALQNQSSTLGLMLSIYKTSNDSLVDTWRETNLSLIGLYEHTDEMFAGLTNQMVNYFGDLWKGIQDFDANLNNTNIAAGAADAFNLLGKEIEQVGESAVQTEEDLDKLKTKIEDAFGTIMDEVESFEEVWGTKIDSVIDKNEELVQSLLRVVSILALVNSDDAEFQAAYDEYNAAQQKYLEGLGREVTIEDIRYSLARTNDPEWEAAKAKFDEFMTNWMRKHSGGIMDTGESYDTGGYTGEWGPEGKLAWLHQKELVLNAEDTENLLDALGFVKTIELSLNSFASMLSNLVPSILHMEDKEPIVQEVNITAEFPNVESHNEIEEAFNNLLNDAAQYALSRE